MLHAPALLLIALAVQQPPREPFAGKVVHVADGDTLTVLAGREQVKVRLRGIDAPESGQPFGATAKERTIELAAGKVVTVRPMDTDRYGRIVAEVVLPDGRSLNRINVAEGLAWHYERFAPRDDELRRLQAEARAAKRGLWADPSPVAPWDWRAGKGRGEAPPAGAVVGNRNSRLYHGPTCKGAAKITETNRVELASPAEAEARGYRAAGDCRPKG